MIKKQRPDQLLDSSCIPLETLLQYTGCSIYALVHRSKKLVQVYGSASTLAHLGRLLEEIKTSGEYKTMLGDIQEMDLVILETNLVSKDIKIAIGNWIFKYKERGYSLYKDISPMRLVLETRVEYKVGRLHYFLYAVGQGDYRKLLGTFEKKKELRSFLSEHYKGDRISSLVVHESATSV